MFLGNQRSLKHGKIKSEYWVPTPHFCLKCAPKTWSIHTCMKDFKEKNFDAKI